MIRPGAKAILLVLMALAIAAPARSQVQSVDTSKPIVIKKNSTKVKPAKFLGEVLSSNNQSITVRSRDNGMMIRTFTYGDGIRDKMLQILNQGGYQYGDKVDIESMPGSNIALSIKGKPSRSS
jgi:hypothetical protein